VSSEDVLRAIEALQQGKTIQSYCEPGTSMVPTVRHMQPITLRPVRRPELLRRGDIVLARETVEREAAAEGIPFVHHFTHLVVHGFLHILGYDHVDDDDATTMEALETEILGVLGIPDPYQEG